MFRKNEGPVDRTIRVVAGIVFIAGGLFLGGLQGSGIGLVVAAFGFWFTVTGAIGVCPAYKPFGITTLRAGRRPVPHLAQREVPQVHRTREDALR